MADILEKLVPGDRTTVAQDAIHMQRVIKSLAWIFERVAVWTPPLPLVAYILMSILELSNVIEKSYIESEQIWYSLREACGVQPNDVDLAVSQGPVPPP